MVNFVKTFLFSYFFMLANFSFAQPIVTGLGATYGSDIKNIGINVREYVFIGHKICFGPEASYFPKHNIDGYDKSLIELNLTGHYIFEVNEHLGIYPLTGLNYSIETESMHDHTETIKAFGLNIGGGFHYKVKNFFPFIEYKYITGELSQHVYSIGVLFSFHKNKTGVKHDTSE